MDAPIIPLIMCGGAGTRLWPASRENRPKQFLPLFGPRSTFQDTVLRLGNRALFERPIVVTNRDYRFLVADQLLEIGAAADILLEPCRRDSAPAIVAGAHRARGREQECVVLVVAADHVIKDVALFEAACRSGREAARHGRIVTFGVTPRRVASEFGYICPGAPIEDGAARVVERFTEKPDHPTAERFIREGYLWNSGNFMFRPDDMLAEYAAFEPQSAAMVASAVEHATTDLDFVSVEPEAYAQARAESIDYAVLERTRRAAVVPVAFDWSDVGGWDAVWELSAHDAAGNAARGAAVFLDARNCYTATDKPLIAAVGIEDLLVVASEDVVLVAPRNDAAAIRKLVQTLKTVAPKLTTDHVKVYRPWGAYQSLESGPRYQVKRIVVKPGGRLSLQKHHHRAEHWVVVSGTARVTIGPDEKLLRENESVYISPGTVHRLENPGKIDLELIEVQTGSYLGEDDIVRLDDVYGRG